MVRFNTFPLACQSSPRSCWNFNASLITSHFDLCAPNFKIKMIDESVYLVFTRMPGKSYLRRLRSLLLYLYYVFRELVYSLVCWFLKMNNYSVEHRPPSWGSVVSPSPECGWEGHGWVRIPSDSCGIFQPWSAPTPEFDKALWDQLVRLGPHSRTSATLWTHCIVGASLKMCCSCDRRCGNSRFWLTPWFILLWQQTCLVYAGQLKNNNNNNNNNNNKKKKNGFVGIVSAKQRSELSVSYVLPPQSTH